MTGHSITVNSLPEKKRNTHKNATKREEEQQKEQGNKGRNGK